MPRPSPARISGAATAIVSVSGRIATREGLGLVVPDGSAEQCRVGAVHGGPMAANKSLGRRRSNWRPPGTPSSARDRGSGSPQHREDHRAERRRASRLRIRRSASLPPVARARSGGLLHASGRDRVARRPPRIVGRGRLAAGSCWPLMPLHVPQRDAGHHQTEHVARRRRRHDADDPPAVHDQDPVREREHLVQLRRHDDHRRAVVALLDDPGVHELDRADVHAAGRLGRDEQPQRRATSPAPARPSAGCRRTGCSRVRRSSACGCRTPRPARALGPRAGLERDPPGERRARSVRSRMRFSATENSPTTPSARGPPGRTRHRRRARPTDLPTSSCPRAGSPDTPAQPEQDLGELGLPVALHAGDDDDLAAGHVERDVVDDDHPPRR